MCCFYSVVLFSLHILGVLPQVVVAPEANELPIGPICFPSFPYGPHAFHGDWSSPHWPLQILLASVESFAVRCWQNVTFWCVSLTSVNQRLRKQSRVPEMASTFEKHFIAMTLNLYPGIVSGLVMQQGAAFGCFV